MQERIAGALTDEEKGQYEENFIDMITRMIQTVQNTTSDNNLESRVKNVETIQHQTAEDKFWNAIDNRVPDWREIQKSDDFQSYLNEFDPLLESTRSNVLSQAQSDLNAERAIAVFMNFKNGSQYTKPNEDDIPTPNPLDKHVTPSDTGGGDGDGGIEVVPDLSLEEINKFYVDVSLGKYKTRPTEQASMEDAIRKIHQASQPVEPTIV